MKRFGFIVMLASSFLPFLLNAQVESEKSITLPIGLGISSGAKTEGAGINYGIGYQFGLWNNRLHLNPGIAIGNYSGKMFYDGREQYFTSVNFETNLYFDVIKTEVVSLFLGTGVLVNNSRGLLGSEGLAYDEETSSTSEYVSTWHAGFMLGGGLRISPLGKGYAWSIMPLNFQFGTNYYAVFYTQLKFEIFLN